MRQTLFYIPNEFAGLPLFGFGWLLILWIIGCIVFMVYLLRNQGWTQETRSFIPFMGMVAAAFAFVLPLVAKPEGLPIRGYGVLLLVATVAGLSLAFYRAKKVGLSSEVISNLAFYMFVAGIAGARLFYIIQYWDNIYDSGSMVRTIGNVLNFVEGGLVVYGSLIGALAAAIWFLRSQRLPLLPIADLIAPSLVLGLAIGRIGCLMNGCCYGGICDQPWALTFPVESPPYYDQHRNGAFYGFKIGVDEQNRPMIASVEPNGPAELAGLKSGGMLEMVASNQTSTIEEAQASLGLSGTAVHLVVDGKPYSFAIEGLPERTKPIHPTQLYSSVNAIFLCLLTLAYFPYRQRDGEVFALLIAAYAVTRFLLEVIRTDEIGFGGTGLTISQNVSVVMLLGVAALVFYLWRQPKTSFWPLPSGGPAHAS